MNVSFNFLEESKKIMSASPKKDCDRNTVQETPKAPPAEQKEIFCLCELGKMKQKEKDLLTSMIGDYETTEVTVNTGNDNFLHGALQLNKSTVKYDGDDRGRTFGGNIDYSITGSEGKLKLSFDSTGFGKFTSINGAHKSIDGHYYLNFHEVETVDAQWEKNISKSAYSKTYLINEFKFTGETDDGKISRKIQEGWHSFFKKDMGMNMIQYKYTNELKNKDTATLMTGIGKEWTKDIGHWKCQSKAEIKGGMSINMDGGLSPEAVLRAENKLSNSSLPWVALSTWVQGSAGFMGPSVEGGIMLSFEKKIKQVYIRPFLGIERHRTPMDKLYGAPGGNPYENYHVLGVTIKY
ncbi:MAG: hypothetical protein H7177_13690 [Rhizobacter sp.]|nr:hypothetical protein [Bacteriovorax sp.]